jgi:ligand-binding SRPBCC domain-containing protein
VQIYRLVREQFLPLPPREVFAFFADAHNLERLTPPWLRFEVLTPAPVDMHEGTLLDYRLRLHGLALRWQSRIVVWEPACRFVDRQVHGPYASWVHTHAFSPMQDGTLVTDMVDYAVPGGRLVQRFFVGPDLEKIFDYRARQLDAWVLESMRDRERRATG